MGFNRNNSLTASDTTRAVNFIGREKEEEIFVENILNPSLPKYNILSISGLPGVGKTELLLHLKRVALERGHITALVNESNITPLSVMREFSNQIGKQGYTFLKFNEDLQKYSENLDELKEKETTLETDTSFDHYFSQSVASLVNTKASQNYSLGQKVVTLNARNLLKNSIETEDYNQKKSYLLDILTRSFLENLINPVTSNEKKKLLLFFDKFEITSQFLSTWLLDLFFPLDLNPNLVVIVAGRKPLKTITTIDSKGLKKKFDDLLRESDFPNNSIVLNPLNEEETATLLKAKGFNNHSHIQKIWQNSGGLPAYLNYYNEADTEPVVRAHVVEKFLSSFLNESSDIYCKLMLDLSLFQKEFGLEDLNALSYLSEGKHFLIFNELKNLSFIQDSGRANGYFRLDTIAQNLFRLHFFTTDRKGYFQSRRNIAEYYQKEVEDLEMELGEKAAQELPKWWELALIIIYQRFLLDDSKSHSEGVIFTLKAYEVANLDQKIELLALLKALLNKDIIPEIFLAEATKKILQHLQIFVEHDTSKNKFLETSKWLIEEYIPRNPLFPEKLLNYLLRNRAMYNLGFGRFQEALRDISRVEISKEEYLKVLNLKALSQVNSLNYEQALVDINKVLDLDPKDAKAFQLRSQVHLGLQQIEKVVEDIDKSIELNPYELTSYIFRAVVYFTFDGNIKNIIRDITTAINLAQSKETISGLYAFRANILEINKDYLQSIDDINSAIKLEPDNKLLKLMRINLYIKANKLRIALQECDAFLKGKNSKDIKPLLFRSMVYRCLGRFDDALKDANRAIELTKLKSAESYRLRAVIFSARNNNAKGLQDMNVAVNISPKDSLNYFLRCYIHLRNRDYASGLKDINRAIELEPSNDYYIARSIIFFKEGFLDLCKKDLQVALEIDVKSYFLNWVLLYFKLCFEPPNSNLAQYLGKTIASNPSEEYQILCNAFMLWLNGQTERSVELLDSILNPGIGQDEAFFLKGFILAYGFRDEEALIAFSKVIENEHLLISLAPLRWLEKDRPEFYAKYLQQFPNNHWANDFKYTDQLVLWEDISAALSKAELETSKSLTLVSQTGGKVKIPNVSFNIKELDQKDNKYRLINKNGLVILNNESKEIKIKNIFISYCEENRDWLEKLKTYLAPMEITNKIIIWDALELKTGDNWEIKIKEAIDKSEVAILLVSAEFMASKFISLEELPLLRKAEKEKNLIIMPVIVNHCSFLDSSLAHLQAANDPKNPLNSVKEDEWQLVLRKLSKQIEEIL